MSSSASPLLDLPPELADLIASFLPGPDLLTLRLVNSEIAAKTERSMLVTSFSSLRIILALPASLHRSLQIVKHETLRNAVQSVFVYVDTFHGHVLDNPERLDPAGHADCSGEAKIKRDRRRLLYSRWIDDQDRQRRTGNDERELREVLHWLRECGNLRISIHVLMCGEVDSSTSPQDYRKIILECEAYQPRDYKDIMQQYGDAPYMVSRWYDHKPLQITLNAIKESGVQPVGFGVIASRYAVPIDMFRPMTAFHSCAKAFKD